MAINNKERPALTNKTRTHAGKGHHVCNMCKRYIRESRGEKAVAHTEEKWTDDKGITWGYTTKRHENPFDCIVLELVEGA